ncbi:hypothetical protein [Mesorhizobium sp. M4B.F.Ca.ET.017.02.2.1]|uniref:hypothetical protein n=3 Tax=unclassified Mesorhizobium TaxID=325217 RepID=UPI000FD2A401|nr:hypothetical protein [Mesorhizobium sp. M4B.F.Ca.ET.017.02.2.1]RVD20254.1 hypothetical protein EN738_23385 [Mesorhizobium sp. M4B.F.Ca.ET.017.02.2.1]RWC93762.1 MAG: hypothetical protein EOS32_20145 [Mesorhizobium sp.]
MAHRASATNAASSPDFFWGELKNGRRTGLYRGGGARVTDIVSIRVSAEPAGRLSAGRLRLFAFIAIAAFMIAGPVAEQVFGVRSAWLRSWTMFSAIGMGVIDASFEIRLPDGALVPLDRFEMLGASRNGRLKRIESRDELASVIKRLCTAAGQGADIRVRARQAARGGWQIIHTDAENACAD